MAGMTSSVSQSFANGNTATNAKAANRNNPTAG